MDEHDVRLPNEFDHAQIIIGRLFGAKEHFEKEFQRIGDRRGKQGAITPAYLTHWGCL